MFEIFKSARTGNYRFRLKARNSQIILVSQAYKDLRSCKNGIKSVQKNAGNDARFERKTGAGGKFHFNVLAANKQVIGSSQMYKARPNMEKGIASVKTNAPGAEVRDVTA